MLRSAEHVPPSGSFRAPFARFKNICVRWMPPAISSQSRSDTAIDIHSGVMMLRIFLVVASVLSCSALVMPLHTPRTVASFSSARTSPANMGFEDSLAAMIDGVSAFFAKGGDKKAPVRGPPHNECNTVAAHLTPDPRSLAIDRRRD